MASYLVMTPSGGANEPDSARIIRDGFSFWDFVFPLFWMLWHRMWLYALGFFLLVAFIGALAEDLGAPVAILLTQTALSVVIGLESGNLRAAYLRFRGWQMVSVLTAENLDQAEEIYFSTVEKPQTPPRPAAGPLPALKPAGGPALGLFDYGKGY